MPAIERVTDAQTDALFNFRPGTVEDLADELRTPKQSFAIPSFHTAPETPDASLLPEPTPAEQRREATLVATQILDMADSAASFALSFIGKREAKNYLLSPSYKSIIRPHLAEYLKGKAVDIPPGFLLLFVVVMAYTPLVQRALADRKEAAGKRPAANEPPNPQSGNDEPLETPPILNS
jgi:hypothetical protein